MHPRTLLPIALVALASHLALADGKPADKVPAGGYKPTNEVEEMAKKIEVREVKKNLDTLQERCGFTIPVDVIYDVPMKAWTEVTEWGLQLTCASNTKTGGCSNLGLCGDGVVMPLWFNFCEGPGKGVRSEYKGWNTKIKRVVCRGQAAPAGTSANDLKHSKIQASLKDGTLTVIVHPSDSNVSNNLYDYLEPLLLAE